MGRLRAWGITVAVLAVACGEAVAPEVDAALDASAPLDAPSFDADAGCAADSDCDDDVFCNGPERCDEAASGANALGCVAGAPPCSAATCDESADRCDVGCTTDGDGDGHMALECGGDDCDDSDPDRFPGNVEVCDTRNHDEDCDPTSYGVRDGDDDGYADSRCCNIEAGTRYCGTDCADSDTSSHPGEAESCDGSDNDCDGDVDEGVLVTFYRDLDGDGFGVTSTTRTGCSAPLGYVLAPGDCDDTVGSVHPGALDICNEVDDDCSGTADPDCTCTIGATRPCGTSDGAGGFLTVGICRSGTQDCPAGNWSTACAGSVAPAAESCNGADDDCDGTIDDGVTNTFYRDLDGDGYGDAASMTQACAAPLGHVLVAGDCDDAIPAVHPTAAESCNGRDEDCDGAIDEGVLLSFSRDADGDGFGDPTATTTACSAPAGFVSDTRDCDDGAEAVHPGAADGVPVCNLIDDNCDGTIDPGCVCASGATRACGTSDGAGGLLTRGICHPGSQPCTGGTWGDCSGNVDPVPETCNMLDDDCDGVVDDGVLTSWHQDCDRDGYGAAGSVAIASCAAPPTPPACGGLWVANSSDCNDGASATHVGATEVCNAIDDDCDGVVDGPPAEATCAWGACTPTGCDDAIGLSTGFGHTCALRRSGVVLCWGQNYQYAELGDGTRINRSSPTPVSGSTDAVEVAAGHFRSCARRPSGGVMCWGDNSYGALGDGLTHTVCAAGDCSAVPVVVSGLSDAVEVAIGGQLTCARRSGGAVACWGMGPVGDGTSFNRSTPVAVSGLTDAVEISVGGWEGGWAHACARRASGAVVCWGTIIEGGAGVGYGTPTAVSGLVDAVELAAGGDYTCARRASGAVVCWGMNGTGQLGDGTLIERRTPVAVSGLSDAVGIAAGRYHTCARRASGAVVCWGLNSSGIGLGDGLASHGACAFPDSDCSTTPVQVSGLTDAVDLAAGLSHTCARRATGAIVCWGSNGAGELGDGTNTPRPTPVTVLTPP